MKDSIEDLCTYQNICSEFGEIAENYFKSHGFTYMGEGRCRVVFLHPNQRYVIKVPFNELGFQANHEEHQRWHRFKSRSDKNGIFYAPCRLIQNTLLMMWRVDYVAYDDRPEWSCYLDCAQVGTLADGRMVAYDFQRN